MTTRKLKTLTLREKVDVIQAVRRGTKRKEIFDQYGLPASTLSTILKNESEILLKYETSNNLSCKRQRLAEFPDVEECLLTWFKQCREKNLSISGTLLREKAEEFSKSLGHTSFRASNGWLGNFKKRHELVFRKLCGESASVNTEICDEWIVELLRLLKDYELRDIFNADETGLFFKCLPDKSLIFKNEKCHGGKHSKERLTVLLATNMTGTEKLKPLVIGKAKKPRCFSGCKSLPVDYEANKKAWMTADIFKQWLIKLDKQMIREKRKILLFIDNCTAHNVIPLLKAVKVKFLPPNTTSRLQPLDQGIIKNFKSFYRKEVVKKLIADMEQKTVPAINVLHAIRMIDKAWRNVSESTIVNCFRTCGFTTTQREELTQSTLKTTPDDTTLEEWNKLPIADVQFEDYVSCDADIATTGTLTDDEIVNLLNQNQDLDDDDGDDEDLSTELTVSNTQAQGAIKNLRIYIERCNNVDDRVIPDNNSWQQSCITSQPEASTASTLAQPGSSTVKFSSIDPAKFLQYKTVREILLNETTKQGSKLLKILEDDSQLFHENHRRSLVRSIISVLTGKKDVLSGVCNVEELIYILLIKSTRKVTLKNPRRLDPNH
ncbi:tigger transposable element-derived protein 6-like [Microplitis mediator]|uniref:tigger transposable element-derived protein 6-like n=1 Tax=Microplitis mediator TaxID=375433 RepID=UPI002555959C|nr:tigger transposable element-derived protein 6-like [Microplitis mediator]